MPDPTTDRLAKDIEAAGKRLGVRWVFEVEELVKRVRAFEFHDFKSQHDMPKVELHRVLYKMGLRELAEAVANGEYDEGREEAIEWSGTAEGRECVGALLEGKKVVLE